MAANGATYKRNTNVVASRKKKHCAGNCSFDDPQRPNYSIFVKKKKFLCQPKPTNRSISGRARSVKNDWISAQNHIKVLTTLMTKLSIRKENLCKILLQLFDDDVVLLINCNGNHETYIT